MYKFYMENYILDINPIAFSIGPIDVYLYGLAYMAGMVLGLFYALRIIEAKKEVHLNLKDVEYMDSSGISVLIESHQQATENETKVVLKEISKSVLKVIMMAKLEQILNLD